MNNKIDNTQILQSVAYQLMSSILYADGKISKDSSKSFTSIKSTVTKKEILELYKECLESTKSA